MWNFITKIFFPLTTIWISTWAVCTPTYGGPPCIFLPAPPGRTPPCARPGDTFCEQLDEYPMQQIRYLLQEWSYDYNTLLNNEIRNEFSAYFTQPDYNYEHQHIAHNNYQPEPIYIPKPNPTFTELNHKYIPPPANNRQNYTDNFIGYPDRKPAVKYPTPNNQGANFRNGHGHVYHNNYFLPNTQNSQFRNGYYPQSHQPIAHFQPNNDWRYSRHGKNDVNTPYPRAKRDEKVQKLESSNNATTNSRKKRQTLTGQQLCQTRSQFIMPQAALNNKGNWMYIVNLQEANNQFTQLVKSETCASQQCNGLCSIPAGYTSRCEQKYIQKRLVALEGAGQNLYNDVFWFPSCCVCTISNANG